MKVIMEDGIMKSGFLVNINDTILFLDDATEDPKEWDIFCCKKGKTKNVLFKVKFEKF